MAEILKLENKILQGRYRIKKLIGYGAYGQVWDAFHDNLEILIAIKAIRISNYDLNILERVKQECKIGGELADERGIIRILDAFIEDEIFYIVMDLMEGGSLSEILNKGNLDFKITLTWAITLCEALDQVHKRGIIHRDIKPANILFTRNGRPKLGDFGIAHLPNSTFTEIQPGTPGYKAPELETGKKPTPASDIYSLCAVFFHLWSGSEFSRYRKQARSIVKTEFSALLSLEFPNLPDQVRDGLPEVVIKGLERKPDDRISMEELRTRLSKLNELLKSKDVSNRKHQNYLIKNLFNFDISHWFPMIAQIDDGSSLEHDIKYFIISDDLLRELKQFFNIFLDYRWGREPKFLESTSTVISISGNFGVGKSYLAKIMGGLLENPKVTKQGQTARDLLLKNLKNSESPDYSDLKFLLYNITSRYSCKVISISAGNMLVGQCPLAEILLRKLYESENLSGTLWIARIQRKLIQRGLYDQFLENFQMENNESFSDDPLFLSRNMITPLAKTLKVDVVTAKNLISQSQCDDDLQCVDELIEFALEVENLENKDVRIVFVVDELYQLIENNSNRLISFQALIEKIQLEGKGRIWLIFTSQMVLQIASPVIEKLKSRILMDIHISESNAIHVIQKILARKNQEGLNTIKEIYNPNREQLSSLFMRTYEKSPIGLESFYDTYPFPPYMIPILQDIASSHARFTQHLKITTRTLLRLIQKALHDVSDFPIGVLVPIDAFFEPIFSTYAQTKEKQFKEIVETQSQLSARILKTLWLIHLTDWLPKIPKLISALLLDKMGADIKKLDEDVHDELNKLVSRNLVVLRGTHYELSKIYVNESSEEYRKGGTSSRE